MLGRVPAGSEHRSRSFSGWVLHSFSEHCSLAVIEVSFLLVVCMNGVLVFGMWGLVAVGIY